MFGSRWLEEGKVLWLEINFASVEKKGETSFEMHAFQKPIFPVTQVILAGNGIAFVFQIVSF